jgi:hypothetical protein
MEISDEDLKLLMDIYDRGGTARFSEREIGKVGSDSSVGMRDSSSSQFDGDRGLRIQQWLLCQFEPAWADHMYRAIRRSGLRHRSLYSCET